MKNNVYLKASKRIVSESEKGVHLGCCYNIKKVTGLIVGSYKEISEIVKFDEIFKPENPESIWYFGFTNEENVLVRSLALLFMHEIVNDKK